MVGEALFEFSKDAILLMDGLQFVDCNPATLGMFGCRTKEDILGKTPLSISPSLQPGGLSSAKEAERLVAAATAGEPQHFEWRHRKFDGTEFDVDVSLSGAETIEKYYLLIDYRSVYDEAS